MNPLLKRTLRTSYRIIFKNQRRNLITHNALGMEEFLEYRKEVQAKVPNITAEKTRYQKYFLNHGSRFLSYEDVTNLMDLSETEEDLDLLTDILVSICNYKYSR